MTTTATLLVTVAVSALAGCVTVPQPTTSGGAPAAPSQPSAPRQDGHTGPQIVQAPAREALERVGGSRETEPPAAASRRLPAAQSPARRSPHPHPRARHSERPRQQPPRVEIPDVSEAVRKDVRSGADVCALGRKYGGWRANSPEAVICEQTYGR
ncbi:hypothetical protein [Streptomyces sp. HUAS ZL42]|uniref:hypothetical protein n=1 Tax=Streptomyces sp. HUAS ZL42 TaxID=3231715 RepID=UPI00345E7D8D